MTKQQEDKRYIERYFLGQEASCYYNDKLRNGRITEVLQGPVYRKRRGREFKFVGMPDGDVYVTWKEDKRGPRTYKWGRVSGFKLGRRYPSPSKEELEKQAAKLKALAAEQLKNRIESFKKSEVSVKRMRPTLGGVHE